MSKTYLSFLRRFSEAGAEPDAIAVENYLVVRGSLFGYSVNNAIESGYCVAHAKTIKNRIDMPEAFFSLAVRELGISMSSLLKKLGIAFSSVSDSVKRGQKVVEDKG